MLSETDFEMFEAKREEITRSGFVITHDDLTGIMKQGNKKMNFFKKLFGHHVMYYRQSSGKN